MLGLELGPELELESELELGQGLESELERDLASNFASVGLETPRAGSKTLAGIWGYQPQNSEPSGFPTPQAGIGTGPNSVV